MREYRATIVAGVLVACVLFLAFVLAGLGQAGASGKSLVVRVHDGDGVVHEFLLDQDARHSIDTSYGHNTVQIEKGTVRMADADCPNRSCMNQEPLSEPGAQIVCLPHKLWVEVAVAHEEGASALDENLVVWSQNDLDTVAR